MIKGDLGNEAIKLIDQGKNNKEIILALGISDTYIKFVRKMHSINPRWKPKQTKCLSVEQIITIYWLANKKEGLKPREIARETGATLPQVNSVLRQDNHMKAKAIIEKYFTKGGDLEVLTRKVLEEYHDQETNSR